MTDHKGRGPAQGGSKTTYVRSGDTRVGPLVNPADVVSERVLDAHRDTVVAVLASADVAARDLEEPATRQEVTAALTAAIDDDLGAALVDLLRRGVDATGRSLQAEPVPASPYLLVTARGPLVRATLADCRLVILLRAFRHDRSAGGYVRSALDPEAAVEVRVRRRP